MNFKNKLYLKYLNEGLLESDGDHFERISKGEIQRPKNEYTIDRNILVELGANEEFARYYIDKIDTFWNHYVCSVPYVLENHVRVHKFISEYSSHLRNIRMYELGTSGGNYGRAVGKFGNGKITTLSDGCYDINKQQFYSLLDHDFSSYYDGHFTQICPERLDGGHFGSKFSNPYFDIIYENCCFQFFDENRSRQVDHLLEVMNKQTGVIFLFEKFNDGVCYQELEKRKNSYKKIFLC